MADEGFKRKLAAILSVDAVGYSRLMEDNEEKTIHTITEYRKIIAEQVKQHEGRVVDSPGDNVLAEFASVVDALKCAVQTQIEISEQNEKLPEKRKMEFRIGVNLGDVAEEGHRIYGDGVNVAARIESLADPGGICISRTAYDQVRKKLTLGYEYLGEHSVKNIDEPVRVYRVLTAPEHAGKVIGEKTAAGKKWRRLAYAAVVCLIIVAGGLTAWNIYLQKSKRIEPAAIDKMAFPLPDKPSIAVLPFDNLSGDPDQGYISDGISESIISALARIEEIFVVSRNSTFVYKGKAVEVKKVAEDLGVRYILEGSYQKSEDKIRVTAQLIDAINGYHLWTDRYDRHAEDFLNLLDEITIKIVTSLQVELTHGRHVRFWADMKDFEAWSYTVEGYSLFEKFTKADNAMARELFERALKIEPENGFVLTMIGFTHIIDALFGYSNSIPDSINSASQIAQKVTSMDDTVSWVHHLWSDIYLIQGKHDKAISAGEKAIELEPSNSNNYANLARQMNYVGRFEEAVVLAKKAIRLSPYCPAWWLSILGSSYMYVGRYQDAIESFSKLLNRAQKGDFPLWLAHSRLAGNYAMMGQYDKARIHIIEARKSNPNYSLETVRKFDSFKNPAHGERLFDALGKAGLK